MQSERLTSPLQFGPHQLDPVARQLRVDGVPAKIGGRAFDLLLMLVERRDRVVPKNEIFDVVWPNLVVEENNLQVHVMALRRLLGAGAIVTVPGRGYRFALAVDEKALAPQATGTAAQLTGEAAGASRALTAGTNLPARLPPLFGRSADLAAIGALVDAHPLVGIVGAGGIGKTRVAQALAFDLRGRFGDGVWMVELASVGTAADLVPAVARALGLSLPARQVQDDALLAQLAGRALLLVLDNCEHLMMAVVPLVARVLAEAPAVRLLATSQEALHVPGERVYRLGTLTLPAAADLGAARGSGAVELFEARATAIDPGFVLSADNLAAVVDICRRLDGIALAIEMAAARLPLLGVDGVRERIDARLRLLTGGMRGAAPRHQTLRATLEWSLALLSDAERRLLRRLGVFVGGFGLAAARAVAGDVAELADASAVRAGNAGPDDHEDWELLDRLGVLVDKSLVVSSGGATPRFRLLETIRALALEQLAEGGESDVLRQRHALWLRALYDRADADHVELSNERWRARYEPELDNLRAALAWAMTTEGQGETAVALAGTSASCWFAAGQEAEGLRYIEAVRPLVSDATVPAVAARYWSGVATLALRRFLPAAQAIEACDRAIALFQSLRDERQQYKLWCIRAYLSANAGDIDSARDAVAQAQRIEDPSWPPVVRVNRMQSESAIYTMSGQLEPYLQAERQLARLYASAGQEQWELGALSNVAEAQLALGHIDAAVGTARDVLARRRARGMPPTVSSYAILTAALAALGAVDEAEALVREAVPLLHAMNGLGELLDHLGLIAALRGRLTDAARVAGCADSFYTRGGFPRQPSETFSRERLWPLLQRSISAPELASLLADGAALTEAQGAGMALPPLH